MLRTEVTLDIREFDQYTFPKQHPIPLTIFCKYLRAILDFSDPFDLPVSMRYEGPGHPVLFELSAEGPAAETAFDVQFIFASRHAEEHHPHPLSPQATPHSVPPTRPASVRRHRTHTPLQTGRLTSAPQSIPVQPLHPMRETEHVQADSHHVSLQVNAATRPASLSRFHSTARHDPALHEQQNTSPIGHASPKCTPLLSSKTPVRSAFDHGQDVATSR